MVVDVKIGSYSYCGTGQAKADKADWGGAHAEAYSQAFRRACAQPGLGLYFYGMEEMEEVAARNAEREQRGTTADQVEPTIAGGDIPDPLAEHPGNDGPPSDAQLERLQQLAESNIFTEASLDEHRAEIRAHYTRGGVGLALRRMKLEYFAATGEEFSQS
jgi:hypothetical protein